MTRRQQKTRQAKTPRQRAEEQLGVAERIAFRLNEKVAALAADLAQVEAERDAAVKRAAYAAGHPDLSPLDVPLPLDGES